jgi:anti-anti-sigma regulatory factor
MACILQQRVIGVLLECPGRYETFAIVVVLSHEPIQAANMRFALERQRAFREHIRKLFPYLARCSNRTRTLSRGACMKFYLIVAKGKKQGMPIPIEVDLFLIGSGKECQLRAIHDQIGDQHCALVMRDRKVFIRDLGSDESTVVNGDTLPSSEEWPLHAGDLIEVGPLKFMIQYHEKALSKRDLEEWALKCLDLDSSRKITAMDRLEAVTAEAREMDDAASAASAILDRISAQRGIVKGRLRISREAGITIVRINDVYLVEEAELSMINKELRDNLNRNNLKIVLDLKNVRRMSSAAAEMFGELQTWLRPFGSRLAMCRVRPEMLSMLKSFPATQNIPFFPDKPAALASHW